MKHTHKKDVTQETLNAVVRKVKSTLSNVATHSAPPKAADNTTHTLQSVTKEFLQTVHRISHNQNPRATFGDYVHLHALSIFNTIQRGFLPQVDAEWHSREAEYMRIIKKYSATQAQDFAHLAALTTLALDFGFGDFLGSVYMELDANNTHKGQFFTPYHLSVLSAELTLSGPLPDNLSVREPLTLMEPACGSGSMVIAAMQCLKARNVNYQRLCLVAAIDVDIFCCHMTYIQLSLYGVPAVVYHGNTLSMETYATFLTPMTYINGAAFRPWPTRSDTPNARAVQDAPLCIQALHELAMRDHLRKLRGENDDTTHA